MTAATTNVAAAASMPKNRYEVYGPSNPTANPTAKLANIAMKHSHAAKYHLALVMPLFFLALRGADPCTARERL